MTFLSCFYAFGGSLAFAIITNIKKSKLIYSAFGGFIGQFVYLLAKIFFSGDIVCYFLATLAIALYAEIMCRLTASPATIYLMIALIPLVPGSFVYYTMLNFLNGDFDAGIQTGLYTFGISGALSMGILIISSSAKLIQRIRINHKAKKASRLTETKLSSIKKRPEK